MTIPFIDLFKSMKARLFPAASQAKPSTVQVARVSKPSDQRLSKTVLPSTPRVRMEPDSLRAAVPAKVGVSSTPGPRSIAFDLPRTPSFSRPFAPALAILPEPRVERAISLQLSDILDQLPPENIKPPESFDAVRAIVLKASEVEKGMASGKPSVTLATIYQQAPEIFLNSIAFDNDTPVFLPLIKVMEQFDNLKVRGDQVSEQTVPQLETPFLAVTLEDTHRFGTTMKPLEASSAPPVKVETATAKTLAAAEPEAAVREAPRVILPQTPAPETLPQMSPKMPPEISPEAPPQIFEEMPLQMKQEKPLQPRPSISLDALNVPAPKSDAADPPKIAAEKKTPDVPPIPPQKISFQLPPNGTGVPASERVPASSGPPVPNFPKTATPAPLPFKFTSPSDDIRPRRTLVPGVEPKEKAPSVAKGRTTGDPKVALPLQSLLQQMPAFQLSGSPMTIGDDVFVEFPLSLIEPQLASGRVMVPSKVFQRAIPEMHREIFVIDQNDTPVSLPLQEVLRHLPTGALRMRSDQEETKVTATFTTPFSMQAEEDAKRFNAMAVAVEKISAEPVARPVEAVPDGKRKTETVEESAESPAEAKAEEIDPKQVIAVASTLPGVTACAISFADGLSLAGNIPSNLRADGICAMAPSLLQKINNHMADPKLGSFKAMTLHCAESSLTFLMHGNICLTALHAGAAELTNETRDELGAIVQKLSRTYSQRESVAADHQGKD
ncbi:MAG: hypothetical protein ABI925_07475 [Verrucomicrobiota bacterium]